MDVIQRRRELLLMQESGLDTSPKIKAYYKYWWRGTLGNNVGLCATEIMPYASSSSVQWISYSNCAIEFNIFKDGTYMDYWSVNGAPRLNANSNGVSVSILIDKIADSYCYIVGTGEILFAGKNTQYYGHRNISELN